MFLKKILFSFLLLLTPISLKANSCSDLFIEAPLFQLTNVLAVGDVTVYNFDSIELKSVIFSRWVYLSSYDEQESHTSIGLTAEGELYILNTNNRPHVGSDRAWLISGGLNIKDFVITNKRFLSMTSESGKLYTINNEFVEDTLKNLPYVSLYELFFGRRWPREGYLKEISDEDLAEQLNADLFLNNNQ